MQQLFGSAPKVVQSGPQSNTSATQQTLLSQLASLLGSGQQPAGVQAYTGQLSAPLSQLQDTSLQKLQGVADGTGVTPGQTGAASNVLNALNQSLGFQAPQVSAPTAAAPLQVTPRMISAPSVAGSTIGTPTINAAQAFQQGVAQPLLDDFSSQVIPAISRGAARSAGGAYSSDTRNVTEQATKQLDRTLAQQGSLYDLGAQQANQGATLTTEQANQNTALAAELANQRTALSTGVANQGTDLAAQQDNQSTGNQVNLANLSALLGTNALNTGASLTGQSDILSAIGLGPTGISAPTLPGADTAQLLESTLGAGAVPQQTQQAQDTAAYTDFTNQQTQANVLRQLMASLGVSPTQTNTSVAQGGSTGLVQSLLGAFAQAAGKAAFAPYG